AAAAGDGHSETIVHTVTPESVSHLEESDEGDYVTAEGQTDSNSGADATEGESRRLSRAERQRQRRERWEQRKLERQLRRQQEREQSGGVSDTAEVAEASPGNEINAPARDEHRYDRRQEEPQYPPAVY